MDTIFSKITKSLNPKTLDFSSVMVVYRVDADTWRGFVLPFDISFEGETREQVIEVLREMMSSYIEALHEYNNPTHLADVPLSNPTDQQKFQLIMPDLMNKLLNRIKRVDTADYYAEAQLPA